MNCPNCGAAMRPVDNRDYLVCDHCTTFHFPEPTQDGIRMIDSDAPVEVRCPVCENQLALGTVVGEKVLFCENCRGVLTSNNQFAEIVRWVRAGYHGPEMKPSPISPDELKRQLHCPGCGSPMDMHPYCGPGNVVIDTCGRCALLWLDHGELARIERYPSPKW